jgi:hypothetical protein
MTTTITENKETKVTGKKEAVSAKLQAKLDRMNYARGRQRQKNDYAGNAKFQKWLKTAKSYKLTIKDGKEILWATLEIVESFDLKISVSNYDQYLAFLFSGIQKPLLRSWVREWSLTKAVKVTYLEYLHQLLTDNKIDYLTPEEHKESQQ